jgi:hypothetical protein
LAVVEVDGQSQPFWPEWDTTAVVLNLPLTLSSRPKRTWISCYAQFLNATRFDRKSGVAQGRDLQFALMEKRNPEAIRSFHIRCGRKRKVSRPTLVVAKVDGQSQPTRIVTKPTASIRLLDFCHLCGGNWQQRSVSWLALRSYWRRVGAAPNAPLSGQDTCWT